MTDSLLELWSADTTVADDYWQLTPQEVVMVKRVESEVKNGMEKIEESFQKKGEERGNSNDKHFNK